MILDASTRRLGGALLASLLVNGLLWRAFGSAILGQKAAPPPIIEISRVVLTPQGKPKPKIVTPKQIQRRVEAIRKLAPPPKRLVRPLNSTMRPRQIVPPPPRPRVQQSLPRQPVEAPQAEKPAKPSAPRPEGSHNRTLTAPAKSAPDAGTVKAGGQADVGKVTGAQNFGEKKTNPSNYVPPAPQQQAPQPPSAQGTPVANATPQPPPPTTAPLPDPTATPRPTATPQPTATPRPEPTNTPRPTATPQPTNTPQPTATPRPKGPTKDAEPTRQVQPDIPDNLRDADFKTSVRVRVDVAADGSSTPSLRTSSGNSQIDALVLKALNRWRWKPALKDGEPVASTQYFKFEFEVK